MKNTNGKKCTLRLPRWLVRKVLRKLPAPGKLSALLKNSTASVTVIWLTIWKPAGYLNATARSSGAAAIAAICMNQKKHQKCARPVYTRKHILNCWVRTGRNKFIFSASESGLTFQKQTSFIRVRPDTPFQWRFPAHRKRAAALHRFPGTVLIF